MYSLDGMHLRKSNLEVSDAHSVVGALRDFLGPIIHSVEFSNFVREPNFFKQCFDLLASSQLSKIVLRDANFREVRWEK